jgi:hypothetical protein
MICPHGHEDGLHPRGATPEEVDAGCELGEAYDPCPVWEDLGLTPIAADTLLGVPDFDHDYQAEHGQGPPA